MRCVCFAEAVVDIPGVGIFLDVELKDLDCVVDATLLQKQIAESIQLRFAEVVLRPRFLFQLSISRDRLQSDAVLERLHQFVDERDARLRRFDVVKDVGDAAGDLVDLVPARSVVEQDDQIVAPKRSLMHDDATGLALRYGASDDETVRGPFPGSPFASSGWRWG